MVSCRGFDHKTCRDGKVLLPRAGQARLSHQQGEQGHYNHFQDVQDVSAPSLEAPHTSGLAVLAWPGGMDGGPAGLLLSR